MSRVKTKKHDTFIDMTAMSDVTVLLLTFFMLTSTFIKKEPVQVTTPSSVSEIKIPEINIMTIIIEPTGQVYMSLDKQDDKINILRKVGEEYKINFTEEELYQFGLAPSFGVPIGRMKEFLSWESSKQDEEITKLNGIPTDSTNNQLKSWVRSARAVNPDLSVAIKADATTPYSIIKDVMGTLQELREHRYNLITSLKTGSDN